jgi:hypothetical protein
MPATTWRGRSKAQVPGMILTSITVSVAVLRPTSMHYVCNADLATQCIS